MKLSLQIGNLLLHGADVTPHLMRVRAAPAHDGHWGVELSQGLLVEDVEHGPGDPARIDGGQQIRLGDDVGAADVDQSGLLG